MIKAHRFTVALRLILAVLSICALSLPIMTRALAQSAGAEQQYEMAQLEALSIDDKYAVQQACNTDRRNSGLTYQDCLQQQVAELNAIPALALRDISADEAYVLQQACFAAQTHRGAAAYRLCINAEIESLGNVPAVDLTWLSSLDRNGIQMGCSTDERFPGVSDYRKCLARELAASGLTRNRRQNQTPAEVITPAAAVVNSTTSAEPLPRSSRQPRIISKPQGDDPVVAAGQPATEQVATMIPPVTVSDGNTLPAAVRAVTPKAPDYTQYAVPSIVMLLGLSSLYLLLKRRSAVVQIDYKMINPPIDFDSDTDTDFKPVSNISWEFDDWLEESLQQPTSTGVAGTASATNDTDSTAGQRTPGERNTHDAADLVADISVDDWHAATIDLASSRFEHDADVAEATIADALSESSREGAELDADLGDTIAIPLDEQPIQDRVPHQVNSSPAIRAIQPPCRPAVTLSAFGQQLKSVTEGERQRQATEFLLYWVSYGDGNCDATRAEYLLHNDVVDEHERIKKWVLQHDANALIDALRCLRELSTESGLMQTLNLMLAILVKVDATPVQNTFFRFFADFIGIGSATLKARYHAMIGRELPSMPRPDSPAWWQEATHTTATASDPHLALLGLADDASSDDIQVATEQIRRRFDASWFNRLGPQEQTLVQRHADRYHRACSELRQEEAHS